MLTATLVRRRLWSRNGYLSKHWPQLSAEIARAVRAADVVLDGGICCLEADGRSDFYRLMFHRRAPHFYAFDVLALNGRDLRGLPLRERKRRLVRILPAEGSRLLYLDHIEERGIDLFRAACERDLEGIVAKWALGTYQSEGGTSWFKIKNPEYTQIAGRRELFEARRELRVRRRGVTAPELLLV